MLREDPIDRIDAAEAIGHRFYQNIEEQQFNKKE
jgi:hypothetical protein